MRLRLVTPTAGADIEHITEYLATDTPRIAALYADAAISTFEKFPDDVYLPVHAGEPYPPQVRVLHLPSPFTAYTLHVAFNDDALYLLAAFAPGLPDAAKVASTLQSLKDVE